jgi:hypothetical protein
VNAQSLLLLIRCHRPGRSEDSRIRKAVKAAETDAALQAELTDQLDFDARVVRALGAIQMPDDVASRVAAVRAHADAGAAMTWRILVKHPAILAGAFAALVMLVITIFLWRESAHSFAGKDNVAQMIATTQQMTGVEMEPVTTQAGKLEDWLFLKYGLEHFTVPPEFAGLKTLGCRVFKQNGHPVAQIAIDQNRMLFFIFRSADFNVELKPQDRWNIFQQEDWVAAIRGYADKCFMIAFRGNEEQMEKILSVAGKSAPAF